MPERLENGGALNLLQACLIDRMPHETVRCDK